MQFKNKYKPGVRYENVSGILWKSLWTGQDLGNLDADPEKYLIFLAMILIVSELKN